MVSQIRLWIATISWRRFSCLRPSCEAAKATHPNHLRPAPERLVTDFHPLQTFGSPLVASDGGRENTKWDLGDQAGHVAVMGLGDPAAGTVEGGAGGKPV